MNIFSVVGVLYIISNSWNFTVALIFLSIPLMNHRRCRSFSTILACNTALAALIYSATNVSSGIYILIWDQQVIPTVDALCSVRAYIYHSSIAAFHHSFVLQAIHKFCKIKGSTWLSTRCQKICFILFQWLFDFTFDLPALVTGNMVKLISDNICFVTLSKLEFVIYMSVVAYFLPDIIINVTHKLLVRYTRKVASRVNTNQERQMRRDLIVVRRIVMLNLPMAIVGIPVLIIVILTIVLQELLPHNILRIVLFTSSLPISIILIILFRYTPELRASVHLLSNKAKPPRIFPTTRAHPRPQQSSTLAHV